MSKKRKRTTKHATMPRAHYNAVRRVLKLLDGYLRTMPNKLLSFDGGVMSTTELWEHAQAATELMPAKPRAIHPSRDGN